MFDFIDQALTPVQERAKAEAIERCRDTGRHETVYCKGGEGDAYAYPGAEGKINWGFNGSQGINIARGIVNR